MRKAERLLRGKGGGKGGYQASSTQHTVSIASGVIRKLMASKEPSWKSSVVSSRDAAQPFTLSQPKSWPHTLESAHLIAVLISQVWRVSFIAPMGLQLSRAEGYGGSHGAGSQKGPGLRTLGLTNVKVWFVCVCGGVYVKYT